MKKRIIIFSSFLLLLAVLFAWYKILINNNIKDYFKYNTSITITSKSFSPIIITLGDDGLTCFVNSNIVNKKTYIKNREMYYLDGNKVNRLKLDKDYRDIYNIIKKLKRIKITSKDNKRESYEVNLNINEVNNLLDALFFQKKSNKDYKAYMELTDKKITSFKLNIDDIEGYDLIEIDIKFQSLKKDFNIENDIITNQDDLIPGKRKHFQDTKINIYEIID